MARDRVEAVERALTILDAFHSEDKALALQQIAVRTGFYKSTILRLAGSLELFGYLIRGEDGLYRLGPSLWRLGALYRDSFDLGPLVRPVIASLAEKTQESSSFYIRDAHMRVCLFRQNSPQEARFHIDEGARLPLDVGATGKVLLAYGGEPGKPFAKIRSDGFCISRGERCREATAVAAPVLDADGAIIGALSVSGLATRFRAQKLEAARKLVVKTAAQLSKKLGAG